jgi:hypothetical protein
MGTTTRIESKLPFFFISLSAPLCVSVCLVCVYVQGDGEREKLFFSALESALDDDTQLQFEPPSYKVDGAPCVCVCVVICFQQLFE